jgi:MFS family permease
MGVLRVDRMLLKFSQGGTALLTALAFVLQAPALVAIAAAVLAISAAVPAAGPLRLLYRSVLVPARVLAPRLVEDDPAPHRFAQGVGAAFLIAASIALLAAHAGALGWALDLVVFVLSTVNFTVGFCAGCFVYYHLGRLGVLPRVRYAGGFHWRGA